MTQEPLEHGNLAQKPIDNGNVTQEPIEHVSAPREPVDQAMGTAIEERKGALAWLSGPTRTVVIGLGVVAVVGVVAVLVGLGAEPKKEAEDSQAAAIATAASRPTTAMGAATAAVAPGGNAAPASVDAHTKAGELRREATKLCRDSKWDKCMANFDEAARLDPVGDGIVPIQRWRAAAAAAKK